MTKRRTKTSKSTEIQNRKGLNPWIWHSIALASFLFLSILYFYPQLQGKVIVQGDIISYKAASHELQTYAKEEGRFPLWTNSMFSGMPSFQIGIPTPGNRTMVVEKIFNLFLDRPIGYFVAMMIGFYIMGLAFGMSPLVALIGSIAFGFTVNHFVLFEAGHTAKLRAFTFFGIIVAGIVNAYRGKYLLGAVLFALGMACEIGANHIQMPYYLFMSLLVYIGLLLYKDLKNKNIANFLKASGYLAIALILAVAANTSRLWTTIEYAEETMRGKPILTKSNATTASSSEVEGLAWDYAMQWSNSSLDLLTYVVPGIVGGGSREPVTSNSDFARLTGQAGANEIYAPLYWGSLPFTSGPSYAGAIIFFLFILGAIVLKGEMRWWLISATVLTLLLSMGKNFEFFNRLFFDYFPMYNKFRTPNSVASVTEFLMILMATWTLAEIVKGTIDQKKLHQGLIYAGAGTLSICLLLVILGPSLFSFTSPNDVNYDPRLVEALINDRKSLLQSDGLRTIFYIALAIILLYLFNQRKIKSQLLLISLAFLIIVDIWGIGKRYLNENSFVRPNQSESALQPRQVDQLILKDQDLYYRVHDLSVNTYNSSIPAYHHKIIGGYHAAKLQRYQDMIDYYLSKNHMPVLNMLNAKYIINPNGELQINTQAMGNAWFVNQVKQVQTANDEIERLQNMDPKTTALVHQEFSSYVSDQQFSGSGGIELISYHPERLEYKAETESEQFAVFSEVWYGNDKGWSVYIDDKPTDFIRVNYILRGMKIPAGSHNIRFEFHPKSFYTGEIVSNIASILILAIVALVFVNTFKPIPIINKYISISD